MEVDSTPGSGSAFTFELDFMVAVDVEVTSSRGEAFAVGGRGLRVLLVDDNAISRQVLARYMTEMSFEAKSVGSGAEALAALRVAEAEGRPFDLLLLDWRMPEMDGLEAARRVRFEPGLTTPPTIIMVTAYGREEVDRKMESLGIQGLLVKPVTRSVLLDAIAEAFGREPGRLRVTRPRLRPAAGPVVSSTLRGARVLVVEDNAVNRQVAQELLEGAGVEVTMANNGREAVSLVEARGEHLDAILMDLQMPEMDGYEAAREIRRDPRRAGLPIVAMTAHALADERQRCREAGMNDHVAKPVDPDELFAVLARVLGRAVLPAVDRVPPVGPTLPVGPAPPVGPASPPLEVPGVDVASALARLGGNRKLLVRLLLELAREWRDGAARIAAELARGARADAERHAHTLRGAAANLGADGVAAAARTVEDSIRHGDGPALREALPALAACLETTLDAVTARLSSVTTPDAPRPDADANSPRDLGRLVSDLGALLERRNLRARDVLAELQRSNLPVTLREALVEIEAHVTALAYGPAAVLLRNASSRVGLADSVRGQP
jgi:two-component system sensor histidine kinase/response regulator